MKAFLAAVLAMVVISVGADMLLDRMSLTTENVYSKESVRLGDAPAE